MTRHLLSIPDITPDEIKGLLKRSEEIKEHGGPEGKLPMEGKTLGLIFEKSSIRTRVSFEVGMLKLGGNTIFITHSDSHIGRGELTRDTARVIARYLDGVVIRTFAQENLDEFAAHSSVPVINGLSDKLHPCQILSDVYTICEIKGGYERVKVAYIGDGNNIANSWILASAHIGLDLRLACPVGYGPDKDIVETASRCGFDTKRIGNSPLDAVMDADVLYTDVWTSMGQEEEAEERSKDFQGFQLNRELLAAAKNDAIVMHCLPAHRGEEITDEVIEGPQSVVFDQAENRLWVQMAILEMFLS